MSTNGVSPSSPSILIGVAPPSSPLGTMTPNAVGDACTTRAGTPPKWTAGTRGRSSGKPVPWMVMRPPSIAQAGRTAVTREDISELCVVQFDVPVEIVAPALWSVPQADGDTDGRRRVRTLRRAQQMHISLGGCPAALPAIAGHATGNDVLPILS